MAYRASRCMFFLICFDTSRMECLLSRSLSLRPIFSDFLPPSLPPQPAFSLHCLSMFSTPPIQNNHFWTEFHSFLKNVTLPGKRRYLYITPSPRGPISHSLPPILAFSLHVFLMLFDTSHMECLLSWSLSLRPIFSDFLPPSLPPQPAFSLHFFLFFQYLPHRITHFRPILNIF